MTTDTSMYQLSAEYVEARDKYTEDNGRKHKYYIQIFFYYRPQKNNQSDN